MHYTVDYKNQSKDEKFQNAINDSISYLGDTKFNALIEELRKIPVEGRSYQSFELQMGVFAGIQGYPVKAIWDYAYPEG